VIKVKMPPLFTAVGLIRDRRYVGSVMDARGARSMSGILITGGDIRGINYRPQRFRIDFIRLEDLLEGPSPVVRRMTFLYLEVKQMNQYSPKLADKYEY
jgi:hypothetical protein